MNAHLHTSKRIRNDEHYTRIEDVAQELQHYKQQLRGKRVYCPCDDYRWSAFCEFLTKNFDEFGLAHLTCTCIDNGDGAFRYDYDGQTVSVTPLTNGGFDSPECTEILAECDIVITNGPFSLQSKLVRWIGGKEFLLICDKLSCSGQEIFPRFVRGEVRFGYTIPYFEGLRGRCKWMTTLHVDSDARGKLSLNKSYSPEAYPKYDNYDAIEVGRVSDIPKDYYGEMGVPITALDKDLSDFDIIGLMDGEYTQVDEYVICNQGRINGRIKFKRLIIRRKKENRVSQHHDPVCVCQIHCKCNNLSYLVSYGNMVCVVIGNTRIEGRRFIFENESKHSPYKARAKLSTLSIESIKDPFPKAYQG